MLNGPLRLVYQLMGNGQERNPIRRQRVFRDRTNPLDVYNDAEFRERFRFRREDVLNLCEDIGDAIDVSMRQGSLPVSMQILIALRYFACGSFQIVIGDLFGVHRSTVSRVVDRVSRVVSGQLNNYVRMPSAVEATENAQRFYQMANFPNVFGCIDCTHVPILTPTVNEAEYVDRRGDHSLNCQLLCGPDLRVYNCVVNWPGSVHDARILRESQLFKVSVCVLHLIHLILPMK